MFLNLLAQLPHKLGGSQPHCGVDGGGQTQHLLQHGWHHAVLLWKNVPQHILDAVGPMALKSKGS